MWLIAHNFLFQSKPPGLPEAAVVVVDESFVGTALCGVDPLSPVQLTLTSLDDDRTGHLTGSTTGDGCFSCAAWHGRRCRNETAGGLLRSAFVDAGFTAASADEWMDLEWAAKPKVKITAGMDRYAALAVLHAAAESGFTKLRPQLAKDLRTLLDSDAARSVNATVVRNAELPRNRGTADVVQFEWREDFAAWVTDAPKLFLDATTRAEVLQVWAPNLEIVDIEVKRRASACGKSSAPSLDEPAS